MTETRKKNNIIKIELQGQIIPLESIPMYT